MENILEDLKRYFRDTPREKVLRDWAETKKNSPKGGPKLKDFLCMTGILYGPIEIGHFTVNGKYNNNINPKQSSGSLFLYRA